MNIVLNYSINLKVILAVFTRVKYLKEYILFATFIHIVGYRKASQKVNLLSSYER